jgi:hypothetical protein
VSACWELQLHAFASESLVFLIAMTQGWNLETIENAAVYCNYMLFTGSEIEELAILQPWFNGVWLTIFSLP